jgi:VanZ family protein
MPWVLHFFIALILTLLLFYSKLCYPKDTDKRIASGFVMMVGLILMTEWLQSILGRNVEFSDLAVGLSGTGIATAYLVATQCLKSPSR